MHHVTGKDVIEAALNDMAAGQMKELCQNAAADAGNLSDREQAIINQMRMKIGSKVPNGEEMRLPREGVAPEAVIPEVGVGI